MRKNANYRTIALISHASQVILKILQARLQQYTKRELPDVQAGVRKGRRTREQIANIRWIIKKAREFQKNIYFCFIDVKAFDCVDHNKKKKKSRAKWLSNPCKLGDFQHTMFGLLAPACFHSCFHPNGDHLVSSTSTHLRKQSESVSC